MKDSRTKILDTAEKLFASRGVKSVSVREINAAAGVGNGLLQYHFHGQDGVIAALLERRYAGILVERQTMIERLRAAGTLPSKRDIMEVHVLPLARLAIEGGPSGKRFIKMLTHLYQSRNKQYQKISSEYFATVRAQLNAWLNMSRSAGESDAVTEVKYWVALNAMMTTLAELDAPGPFWVWAAAAPNDPDALARNPWKIIEILINFMVKGIE